MQFLINIYLRVQVILHFITNHLFSVHVLQYSDLQWLIKISNQKVLISNICSNLSTIRCICITSNLSTDNFAKNSVNNKQILCSIPVNVSPFSIIIYQNLTGFKTNLFSNNLNYVNLKLIDQDVMLINLNGCHWSCVLQIDVVNFTE